MEILGDYTLKLLGADIGLFGRYSNVHGRADLDVLVHPVSAFETDMDIRLDRKVWLVGGKISMDFNLF